MVKLNIFILLTLLVLTVVSVGAVVPNPGHSLAQIENAQARVTGTCNAGSSIRVINVDGTVSCETDDAGQAVITNGLTQCSGVNQAIKTIDPATGTVTCETDDVGAGGLTGSGTANYVTKFNGASSVTNSQIQDTGDNIFIGSTSMPEAFWSDKLRIVGGVDIVAPSATDNWDLYYRLNNRAAFSYFSTAANNNLDVNRDWNSAQGFHSDFNSVILWGSGIGINQAPNDVFEVATTNGPANRGITISGTSSTFGDIGLKIKNTGTGGVEWFIDSTNSGSGYGGGKLTFVTPQGGNVVQSLDSANGGRVGIGTTSPTEKLDVAGNVKGTGLCIGADCRVAWPSGLSGSGTANYVTKFNGASSVTNSQIYDAGANVGIGTTTPTQKLEVNGNIQASWLRGSSGVCIGADCRSAWPASVSDTDCVMFPVAQSPPLAVYPTLYYAHGTSRGSVVLCTCTGSVTNNCPGDGGAPADRWYANGICAQNGGCACPIGSPNTQYYVNYDYAIRCK